jgi:hypothetical protein
MFDSYLRSGRRKWKEKTNAYNQSVSVEGSIRGLFRPGGERRPSSVNLVAWAFWITLHSRARVGTSETWVRHTRAGPGRGREIGAAG